MPELPEVEFGARQLRKWLRATVIVHVEVPKTRVVRGQSATHIVRALQGHRVTKIDRRGKWIRMLLDDETRAFSHFGMSGRWVKRAITDVAERSERLRIDLESAPCGTSTRACSVASSLRRRTSLRGPRSAPIRSRMSSMVRCSRG